MLTDTSVSPGSYFPRRWLFIARLCWVILFIASVSILIVAVLSLYQGWYRWSQPCSLMRLEEQAACNATQQALGQLGLPVNFPAVYFSIGVMIEVLPWILMGLLIFLNKSERPFEFFFALMLVVSGTFSLDHGLTNAVRSTYPTLNHFLNLLGFFGDALLIVWYRFPDRRFVPRWMIWIAGLWVILTGGANLLPDSPLDLYTWPNPLPVLVIVGFASSFIFAFAYRYPRVSNPLQRQQIKWVVASGSIFVLVYITGWLLPYIIPAVSEPSLAQVILWLTQLPLLYLARVLVAISIGLSILRYRLWDIDFLINRSLVYGALTVLLMTIFGGSLVLVSLFVKGQTFIIAFGVTALLAGTLFQPTRRRIQRFVDRRFYHIYIDYQKKPAPIPATRNIKQVLHQTDFGAYQNLELIGRGGMAEVYKSVHPTLGVTVAIKILPAQLVAEAEFRQRFTREAKIVTQLEHPNIVNVFDAGEQGDRHYIVMEYLVGQDLGELLESNGKMRLEQVLPLVHQIAAALDYAHAHGVVHRDIKPSNIFLDEPAGDNIRAVLTDFGIAKIINAHTAVTRAGSVLGTLGYIAPEQIQAASNVNGKADIYALGVMVYQMLTDELPFKHNNLGALLIAHLTQPPPSARAILPDLPGHVAYAIQLAMSKKPEERFATATEFAVAISRNET